MTELQTAYNNLYTVLITIYDDETSALTPEKRDQIPVVLACLAVCMKDLDKISEVVDKFGIETYNTPIRHWGFSILRTMGIDFPPERPSSPANIQDIETKIIH